jgi:nucleoside-diphosphate-sugar epimerase
MQAVGTGATGFLGRRLVQSLCDDGCAVRCLVRPSSDVSALRRDVRPHWSRIDVRRVQLDNRDACRNELERGDIVFHLAAGKPSRTKPASSGACRWW